MPFQVNTFIRNQNFTRDRDVGPPDSTISADKTDDELDNIATGLTVAKTQAATAESKADAAQGAADAAQADATANASALATHTANIADPHGARAQAVSTIRGAVAVAYDTLEKEHAWAATAFGDRRTNAQNDARYPLTDQVDAVGLSGATRPYLRRRSDGVAFFVERELGFTPVQQGGASGITANKINFGWTGSTVRVSVDGGGAIRDLVNSNIADIGSVCFARNLGLSVSHGQTKAGGDLEPYGTNPSSASVNGTRLPGTWRCLGHANQYVGTLWVRIS